MSVTRFLTGPIHLDGVHPARHHDQQARSPAGFNRSEAVTDGHRSPKASRRRPDDRGIPMTPLIMNIGQDLIRHAVSPKRRLQPVPTGRAVARTINAAETQNLEWSSIPLSMCNSARICQEEPAHQIHLPQLRSPRPLPALVIVPSATASGHLDQPVTHQAAIDRRPARQRLDRRRRQSGQDQPHQRSGRIFTLTFGGCSAERSGRVFCSQTMSTAKYYIFDRYASVLAALNSSWSARSAIMRPCARNVASRTH